MKDTVNLVEPPVNAKIPYRYKEDEIVQELQRYLDSTYSEHYVGKESPIQCFDAWIARGNSSDTFINTAMKYLWRYGKKDGKNRKDLMKALHYVCLTLYVDHYKND